MAQPIENNKKKLGSRKMGIGDTNKERQRNYDEKIKYLEGNCHDQNNYKSDYRTNQAHQNGFEELMKHRNEYGDQKPSVNSCNMERMYNEQTNNHNHQHNEQHNRSHQLYKSQDQKCPREFDEQINKTRQQCTEGDQQHKKRNLYNRGCYTNEDVEHTKHIAHKCSIAVMKSRQERRNMRTIYEKDELNPTLQTCPFHNRTYPLDGRIQNSKFCHTNNTCSKGLPPNACCNNSHTMYEPSKQRNHTNLHSDQNDLRSYERDNHFEEIDEQEPNEEFSDESNEEYEANNSGCSNDNNCISDELLIGPKSSSRSINSNSSNCSKKAKELLKLEKSKCNILTSIDDGIKQNVDRTETILDRSSESSTADTNSFEIISNLVRQRRRYHAQKIIQEANRIKQIDRFPLIPKK